MIRIVAVLNICLLVIALALTFLYGTTRKAESVEAEFADLFERCRAYIETGAPFDHHELKAIEIPNLHRVNWMPTGEQEAWMRPDSLLYVARAPTTNQAGQTLHVCGVTIYSDRTVLSAATQALILRWFLVRHTDLVFVGEYTRTRDALDIPPALFLTYDIREPNARGCSVVSYLVLDREGTSLTGKIGEKGAPCESA